MSTGPAAGVGTFGAGPRPTSSNEKPPPPQSPASLPEVKPPSSAPATATTSSTARAPKRFYRALTPTERLPDGLPEWFARKDADGDGQVSMAEFSSTWDDRTAGEFSKSDLNNDGFITPGECLEAMKPK